MEEILKILKGYSQKSTLGYAVEEEDYELVASEIDKLNKWINVNDKLPEDNQVVLAYDGYYPMVMIYNSKGKNLWDVWSEYGVYGYEYDVEIDFENIKYWKPLNLPSD